MSVAVWIQTYSYSFKLHTFFFQVFLLRSYVTHVLCNYSVETKRWIVFKNFFTNKIKKKKKTDLYWDLYASCFCINPLSCTYTGLGCRGNRFRKEPQTPLSPATYCSSFWGIAKAELYWPFATLSDDRQGAMTDIGSEGWKYWTKWLRLFSHVACVNGFYLFKLS